MDGSSGSRPPAITTGPFVRMPGQERRATVDAVLSEKAASGPVPAILRLERAYDA